MGQLLGIQIIIILLIAFISLFKLDGETKKLLLKIDAVLTAIFIIVDLLLLFFGLKVWLV